MGNEQSSERRRQENDFQQNLHQQVVSPTRIYPTLEPVENPSRDVYQRHMQQNNQRYAPSAPVPSAPMPSARAVNNQCYMQTNTATHRSPMQHTQKNNNFNCPTCGDPYSERIFQCLTGHSCCENCRSNCKLCGLCGQSIGSTRNFSLEEILGEATVPCVNKKEGCMLNIKIRNMENHIKECPYMERPCPLQVMHQVTCHWKGKLSELGAHFNVVHPDNRRAEVGSELIINNMSAFIRISHHFIHLITIGTYNFLLHISVKMSDKILMAVQLCGTEVSASRWSYEFHVYNKQNPRKKFLYTDLCQSYHVPTDEIFKYGAVLPMAYATGFVNSDTFTYKVFITKNEPDKVDGGRPRWRGRGRGNYNRGNRSTSACSNTTN